MDLITFKPKTVIQEPEITADSVLEYSIGRYKDVFVVGYDPEGAMCFTSTPMTHEQLLWMLETFKLGLLSGD